MSLITSNAFMIATALVSLLTIAFSEVLANQGHGLMALFTLLGGGLGLTNVVGMLAAAFLFSDETTA